MKSAGAMILLIGVALAGCSPGNISPNDPAYSQTGAPRRGEPVLQPGNSYGRILGPDGNGSM